MAMMMRETDNVTMSPFTQLAARLSRLVVALGIVVLTLVGCGEVMPTVSALTSEPVVAGGAKITLSSERLEYFLGETVRLKFVLTNVGDRPIALTEGGDYEWSDHALRFEVTATDGRGNPVPQSLSPFMKTQMGGISSGIGLEPGESWTTSLRPLRYLKIPGPGVYALQVTHDLGWPKETAHPVGGIILKLTMPNASQASAVVAAAAKALSQSDGEIPGPDLTALCWPVYLPALLAQVDQGRAEFLESIDLINSREATAALIRLAGSAKVEIAREAARLLKRRLPSPPAALGPVPGYAEADTSIWDAAMAPEVRALGKHLLVSADQASVGEGAALLASVGLSADAPEILAALETAMERGAIGPRHKDEDDILDEPGPISPLVQAMSALRARGYALGEGLSGSAELLLYFTWLANDPARRPENWLSTLNTFGRDGNFVVREAALRSIPQPIPAGCVSLVLERLRNEKDLGALRAACDVAGESGNGIFVPPLLDVISTETHHSVMASAGAAAARLGAGYPLLEAWARRLGDEHLYGMALGALSKVVDGLPGSTSGRTDLSRPERLALRTAWEKFLADHKAELEGGKKFKQNDPALTRDLFGRAMAWQMPDGTYWPARPANATLPYP